jgi:hypothetical protein
MDLLLCDLCWIGREGREQLGRYLPCLYCDALGRRWRRRRRRREGGE